MKTSIVPCADCRRAVSLTANLCPHCGAKMPQEQRRQRRTGFRLLGGIVLACFMYQVMAEFYREEVVRYYQKQR